MAAPGAAGAGDSDMPVCYRPTFRRRSPESEPDPGRVNCETFDKGSGLHRSLGIGSEASNHMSMTIQTVQERSLDDVPHFPEREKPMGFIMRLAKALHTYGVPAYELEQLMTTVAERLGYGLQCMSLPTSITLSLATTEDEGSTFVIRAAPGEINLEKLRRTTAVAFDVMEGRMTPREGAKVLKEITTAPMLYPDWMMVPAFGVASAALARIFAGGLKEIVVAAIIGILVGLLVVAQRKWAALGNALPILSGLLASIVAFAGDFYLETGSTYIPMVSGIIVLLPGLMLTIAMAELATQNLVSGTARLFGAGTIFVQLGLGVAIGNMLGNYWFPVDSATTSISLMPVWSLWFAIAVAGLNFTLLYQSRFRDSIWMMLASLIAYATSHYASAHLGAPTGAFIGALSVGAAAQIVNRSLGVAGAVMMLPGFIVLVPGSVGFRSLTALLEHDVITGLDTAFNMLLVGIALATGFLITSLANLPRTEQVAASQDADS